MRYRDLIESTTGTLYHGSKDNLPIGTILVPGDFTKSSKTIRATEKVLNRYRRHTSLARNNSVFMTDTDNPSIIMKVGGFTDYVFKVTPNGVVEKNNVGWWSKINLQIKMFLKHGGTTALIDPSDYEKMATSYWNGDPCENGLWEYRSSSATIIERIIPLS